MVIENWIAYVLSYLCLDIAFLNIENNENEFNIRNTKFKCKVSFSLFEKEIKFLVKIK